MLETSHRIEASPQDTTPDSAPRPPAGSGASPNRTAWSRRLGRALIGCLVAEAAVGAIALAVIAGAWAAPEPDGDPGRDGPAVSPAVSLPADDTQPFLAAWARSLEQDHRATGTLTRTVLDRNALFTSSWPDPTVGVEGSTATVWTYRHSRVGARTLTQIGDVATVVDPVEGRRTCVRQDTGFVCTVDGGPAGDPMAVVRQAVEGPAATHRIVAVDPTGVVDDFPGLPADIHCWEALSLTDGIDQRWGRRAQFCFHDSSGAAVFRRVLGISRVEILIVESISEAVLSTDLDPA